jgi:hypothetical protein
MRSPGEAASKDQAGIKDLGDGLLLRRGIAADTGQLAAFHADLHRDPGVEEPEAGVAAWVRDLMSGAHPTMGPADFTVVEDLRRGTIVSSLCLISQTWSYAGIPFGVGRPELVATHPDYRRRGLVRAQFDVIHHWSAQRGELVQGITGIPYFYRQFGYEMALNLGGNRAGYAPQVAKLKDGQEEPFCLRPATGADLPHIARLYRRGAARSLVSCVRDERLWRYELDGRSEANEMRLAFSLVETPDGKRAGFVAHSARVRRNRVGLRAYELEPGVSWLQVTPSVVRYLWALGQTWAGQEPGQDLGRFVFWLGAEHPAYQAFQERLPHSATPYAWYLRVPDLPAFLQHIAPVLEQRLAASLLAGHTGQLALNFYRSGLRLSFKAGKLASVEPWQPSHEQGGDAAFPGLTFLQLLFGYRALEELRYAFADCWASGPGARLLLEVLFPKQSSDVWPTS